MDKTASVSRFAYWFSREVGLQQRGGYELKKDFFQVERGKQVYVIPAGREINRVMYVTPSTTKAALYGNLGTLDTGIGGGFGQYGNMGNGMGITGFYVGSAYDTALMSVDLKFKNSYFILSNGTWSGVIITSSLFSNMQRSASSAPLTS